MASTDMVLHSVAEFRYDGDKVFPEFRFDVKPLRYGLHTVEYRSVGLLELLCYFRKALRGELARYVLQYLLHPLLYLHSLLKKQTTGQEKLS